MSYSYSLIEKLKAEKNIEQDKGVLKYVNSLVSANISEMRKGKRNLTANQCIEIAKILGLDPKEELMKLAAEKARTEEEKAVWKDAIKKISAACIFALGLAAAQINSPVGAPHSRRSLFNIT
ncbi:DUF3693 domain-containing protein [Pseudoalteromonas sp. CNC9-20]|uniref:DUF3693 domain-containing protein n=1 Tax=Pseudoalteromonas sp. CNC9-20 TaxID=2917750 RepID=UPI001EF5771A|nr:DUF3693 domain-containing protein [Pseudoalteromonas sp. CNC9-20]MCG7569189.1 DUF3693 domain-containing protein [Pseudoalteromonas sp. CNC9-20]